MFRIKRKLLIFLCFSRKLIFASRMNIIFQFILEKYKSWLCWIPGNPSHHSATDQFVEKISISYFLFRSRISAFQKQHIVRFPESFSPCYFERFWCWMQTSLKLLRIIPIHRWKISCHVPRKSTLFAILYSGKQLQLQRWNRWTSLEIFQYFYRFFC